MNSNHLPANGAGQPQRSRRGRLWLWFLAGFNMIFFGQALMLKIPTFAPEDGSIITCRLWEYYVIEVPRLFGPPQLSLGWGIPSLQAVAMQHLQFSAIGGAIGFGIGWVVNGLKRREADSKK